MQTSPPARMAQVPTAPAPIGDGGAAPLAARATVDAGLFRQAWRGLGSTVALIATEQGGTRHAMLATAVTSVSMEPPSLLVCINRTASGHAALRARGAFSLGILAAGQHEIGLGIGRAAAADRFGFGTWQSHVAPGSDLDGLPRLAEAQATLFCRTDQITDYGSHAILIALVEAVVEDGGARDPLLYCDGRYGRFGGFAA